jgi:hypothetical protein
LFDFTLREGDDERAVRGSKRLGARLCSCGLEANNWSGVMRGEPLQGKLRAKTAAIMPNSKIVSIMFFRK